MFLGTGHRLACLPMAWCAPQALYVHTDKVLHRGDRTYKFEIHGVLTTVSANCLQLTHHSPWHRRCSTTSNSIQHHDLYHEVTKLFVLSEGTAVSMQGVVVVWWTPLIRHTYHWRWVECHLASPKLPLPGWNAVFATWWLFILDLELLNGCWCKNFKNAATVKLSFLT
jgi:hypothetical protein